jgi:tetratricopeptide (TPR) repeat protein
MKSGRLERAQKITRLMDCFKAGDLTAAQVIAWQLVDADSKDVEARYLLAQIVFKAGGRDAIDLMKTTLELDPLNVAYNNDYGVMLASQGRWNEAVIAYDIAAALDRDNIDVHFNLALALFRTGQNERARGELDLVLAQWADLPAALALDGELLRMEGQPVKAVEALRKAIERGLETSEIYINLAMALEDADRGEEAAEALCKADQVGGADTDAWFHLGNFYLVKGNKILAERYFRQTVKLRPNFAEAYYNLGVLLQEKGDTTAAVECYSCAQAADPYLAVVYNNLGTLEMDEGRLESARTNFKRAVEIDPGSVRAWCNLGSVNYCLHQIEESEAAFRCALDIQPEDAAAHRDLGVLLLLSGRFPEGWSHFYGKSHWQNGDMAAKQPVWTGDDPGEQTLLVHGLQGLGDNLQFARYLPLLSFGRARICFWCPPPLYRLFAFHAAAWRVDILSSTTMDLPPFDVWIDLQSLSWRMGTTLENIPARIPYLASPPELAEKWSTRLAQLSGMKVGIVWSGRIGTYAWQKFRSMHLRQFEPLFKVGGIHWVSLQKGDAAKQIAEEGWSDLILNVMDEVEDFADTAAIVANLDLVIGVDTSVPHLAGAMGKPVWLLNRFSTDWRWLLDREDSPWYPTMRIFRQASLGNWDPVISHMAEVLADRVSENGGNPALILKVPKDLAANPATN